MVGIIITGAVQTWRLDGISLVNTGHGRMLLLKVVVVGLMLFVGTAIRRFVLTNLRKAKTLNQRAVYRLKQPVGIELAIGVVVLACSSVLMSMRPPYVLLRDRGPKYEYAIVQDLTGKDDFHVRVSITPGNVGNNRLLVEYFGPRRIQNFTVSLMPTNPAFNGFKVFVPLTRPGAALLTEETGMKLLAPGDWSITVEGTTTTGDLEPLKGAFVIADGVTVTTVPNKNVTATTTTVPAAAPTSAPAGAGVSTVPPAAAVTTTVPPAG
jgi:copper transport protein